MIYEVFVIVFLGVIFYQDLKFRAVYWWAFPLLAIALCATAIQHISWQSVLNNLLINSAFLLAQILFLSLYFSARRRKWVNIFNGYLGLGDLLFLLAVTVYFSFLNYLFFYLVSLFLVILGTILNNLFKKHTDPRIPLAGYQAVVLLVFLLLPHFIKEINLQSDSWLARFLI